MSEDATPDRIAPDQPLPMNESEMNQSRGDDKKANVSDAEPDEMPVDDDGNAVQPVGGDIGGPDLGDGSDVMGDHSTTAEGADSSATGSGQSGGAE